MLQGSLQNFTLAEVLGLLSTTGKSGRLRISGDRGTGSLWFNLGRLEMAEASKIAGNHHIEDVMFELLRYASGNFSFNTEEAADPASPDRRDPSEGVTDVLGAAEIRLDEWRSIEAVVPSLGHELTLARVLPDETVTFDRDEWDLLLAVGETATVGDVAERLGLDEVDGSRRVKQMIERHLVSIDGPLGVNADDEVAEGVTESLAPTSFEPDSFEPDSFEPTSFEPASFEPASTESVTFGSDSLSSAPVEVASDTDESVDVDPSDAETAFAIDSGFAPDQVVEASPAPVTPVADLPAPAPAPVAERPPMPAPPSPAEIESFSAEIEGESPFASGELDPTSLVGANDADDENSLLMRYLRDED